MAELVMAAGRGALTPLSPVRAKARRTAQGVQIKWIRRTRIDGDSWEFVEVPLGEDGERYGVTIVAGDMSVRAVETASPAWLYPAALEIDDFGSPQGEIELRIAQMSTVVGRGQEWHGRVVVR